MLLALVSGPGVDSAKPMIAELGAEARPFLPPSSWLPGSGVCPGDDERLHTPDAVGVNFGGHQGKRRKTCTLAKCKRLVSPPFCENRAWPAGE